MKRALFIAIMILSLCLPALALAQTEAAPRAELEHTVFTAENIVPGSTIQHDFTVKNVGTADLLIKDVRPGCGCSVASFDKVVAPGATGVVSISVNIYDDWAGQHLSKSAHMTTNDPEAANVTLRITGDILPAPAQAGEKPQVSTGE